jgi:hypothetical protein
MFLEIGTERCISGSIVNVTDVELYFGGAVA